MKNILIFIFLSIIEQTLMAQFPPPAGVDGTTAISQDSNIIVSWAANCQVFRGYIDISNPDLGLVDFGQDDNGVGHADGVVVSLGDGGSATLEFPQGIYNGEGADFAVYENSFSDDFLELALVYVSADGVDYHLIPAISYSQTNSQIPGFGHLDATKIHNLAGKYRMGFGTPFDLSEIDLGGGNRLSQISFIKIVDVVGSIQEDYATYDSQGNMINDPWPTPFPSGGFDLDAVGVIHQVTAVNNLPVSLSGFRMYPIPNDGEFYLDLPRESTLKSYEIWNAQGQMIEHAAILQSHTFIRIDLAKGCYVMKCMGQQQSYQKLFFVY